MFVCMCVCVCVYIISYPSIYTYIHKQIYIYIPASHPTTPPPLGQACERGHVYVSMYVCVRVCVYMVHLGFISQMVSAASPFFTMLLMRDMVVRHVYREV